MKEHPISEQINHNLPLRKRISSIPTTKIRTKNHISKPIMNKEKGNESIRNVEFKPNSYLLRIANEKLSPMINVSNEEGEEDVNGEEEIDNIIYN